MAETVHPDTAFALRQVRDFPPVRVSVFEDPADGKSALGTQRHAPLSNFYADREPSWYESTTREFAGFGRVLDLGCGPGLALAALREHGVRETIGVDRWEGFRADVEAAGATLILHDLTLPMPFLVSGSFDGVFSHFALEYISPIGVQQVLREAARVLSPGGLLLLHLTAPGLALGDTARTSPYDESALTRLLTRAGFADFDVEQPEEREITIVHARGPGVSDGPAVDRVLLEQETDGELQVAAGFRASESPDGPIADTSICDRVVAIGPGEFELQRWTWRGAGITTVDATGIDGQTKLPQRDLSGAVEHWDAWRPEPPMLEPPGDAYATIDDAAPGHEPGAKWRARGRRVIVGREGDDPDRLLSATESEDHFLVRRPAPGDPPDTLDPDWKEGRLHGLVLPLEYAGRAESRPLLEWAGSRGALLYLEPEGWGAVKPGIAEVLPTRSPSLIIDPLLHRAEGQAEVEITTDTIASALDGSAGLHLVLAEATARAASALCALYPNRVLIGRLGDPPRRLGDRRLIEESTENLRFLTERTTLLRLR